MNDSHNPGRDGSHDELEARLRDATHAYAETVEPAPDAWARVRGGADRAARPWGERLRAPVAILAGAGAAAAAVGLVLLLTRGGDGGSGGVDMRPATTPGITEPAPPETSTTTGVTPTTVPYGIDGVIGATTDGRVVLMDSAGVEIRTLLKADDGRQVMQLALAPDRGTLWYLSKPAGQYWGCGEVRSVPLDPSGSVTSAAATAHGTANYFALDPEGARLALSYRFVAPDSSECSDSAVAGALSIRSIETGEEQARLVTGGDAEPGPMAPTSLAWSPDGGQLAVAFCWESCDARVFEVPAPGAGCPESGCTIAYGDGVPLAAEGSAEHPAWTKDGRVVVNEHCCYPDEAGGSRVVAFDPSTGARGDVLLDYADTPLRGISTDAGLPSTYQGDTRYLITIAEGSGDVWIPPAESTTLAGDVLAAAWAAGLVPLEGTPGTTAPNGSGTSGVPGAGECSAWAAEMPAIPQVDPGAADTWQAVFQAAAACDWDALSAQMPDEFSYSFGGSLDADEAIAAWQEAEARGEPILQTLVEVLSDSSPVPSDDIWAFGDTEGLGYRAGIRLDGTWLYFVAGD